MRKAFDPDMPIRDGFRQLAIAELSEALEAAEDSTRPPADSLHAARTSCKKLRALLRLAGPSFSGFHRENHAIRDAAAGLAGARDALVMAETLKWLLKSRHLKLDKADRQTLRAAIAAEMPTRDVQSAALAGFLGALRPIRRRAGRWSIAGEGPASLAGGAGRTYAKARKAMKTARASKTPDDLHEWRKQLKYHLYQLAMLRPFRLAGEKCIARLKELTELLGRANDLDVLRAFLGTASPLPEKEATALRDAIAKALSKLSGKATRVGAKLFKTTPKRWRAAAAHRLA